MQDGGAHLGFDVVAHYREARFPETVGPPSSVRAMNTGMQLTKAHPAAMRLFHVVLGRLLRSDGQVGDHHIRPGPAERFRDVYFDRGRLLDHVGDVGAYPIEGGTSLDRHVEVGYVAERKRVVLTCADGLGEVLADLGCVHVEGGHVPDVSDVVAPQDRVHQPGDDLVGRGIPVELHPLHEGGGTIAHAHDRHSYFTHREVLCLSVPT